MLIDIIASMVLFAIAVVLAFASPRVFRHTKNKKLRAKKLAVYTIFLCGILCISWNMYTLRRDWDSQYESELDLMNHKFDSIDEYQFYDWSSGLAYTFPCPWPDEFPFTYQYTNMYGEVGEATVNSYDELPISLDEVWYWYGTQEEASTQDPENAYSVFTHGQILSYTGKHTEQQVFTFVDAKGSLQNLYIVNFPYNNPVSVYADELWFVTVWGAICGLFICFCSNMHAVGSHLKEIKKNKGGK